MTNSDEIQTAEVLSPGKQLLQGRLQLGLTQEQVAKELYITLAKIKALESDDYGRLNTDTFIRGYIRAYANLLKLDVVEILSAYDQIASEKNVEVEANLPTSEIRTPNTLSFNKSVLQLLLVIGVFFVGLWLISVWFFDNHSEKNYPVMAADISSMASSESIDQSSDGANSSDDMVDDTVQAPLSVSVSSSMSSSSSSMATMSSSKSRKGKSSASSIAASSGAQSSDSVAAKMMTVIDEDVSTASEVKTGQTVKSNTLDTIYFNFRAESWLEVSDSRGDVLATELQAAGSTLTLVGKAPFNVKLGNAPAVDIKLNGKKVDVIPLIGSNVLTLRVSN